jgi:hypothetical protein
MQSTRPNNGDVLLDCPMRLNIGASSGTQQYIESLQSLVGAASGYWQKRYPTPKASLNRLILKFYSYAGDPIPIEKMLQTRDSINNLNQFILLSKFLDLDPAVLFSSFPIYFIFDPSNPQLLGRTKRYIQMILKSEVYQGLSPGLQPTTYANKGYFS